MTRRILLFAALSAVAAYAHHSLGATYDAEKEVKVEGKIVQFLLRNPHSFLQIESADKTGGLQRWSLGYVRCPWSTRPGTPPFLPRMRGPRFRSHLPTR